MDGLSVQTVAREEKCLFRSLTLLLEDEGQYNRLRHKAAQCVHSNWKIFRPFFPVNENNNFINSEEDYKVCVGKNKVYWGSVETVAISGIFKVSFNIWIRGETPTKEKGKKQIRRRE
jgi:hypothetical protein